MKASIAYSRYRVNIVWETKYRNAVFIQGKSSHGIINCWASVHTGFTGAIRLDRETSFTSAEFSENVKDIGIHMKCSEIEAHNSIGVRETFRYPPKRILDIVKKEYNQLRSRII